MSISIEINNRKCDILVNTGLVAGVRKLSETHVKGHLHDGSGNIRSTVVNHTEFAVICPDGVERPYLVNGHKFFCAMVIPCP